MCVCVARVFGQQALEAHLTRADMKIHGDYAKAGADKFLLSDPPIDNPRNIADYDMQCMFYEVGAKQCHRGCFVRLGHDP